MSEILASTFVLAVNDLAASKKFYLEKLGFAEEFIIHTPLMRIDKCETWRLAEQLGSSNLVRLIVEDTVTCYEGERTRRHDWGYGCGVCPACRLRAAGYARYSGKAA
jgi:7-cyano-7-deazaguanine synthase